MLGTLPVMLMQPQFLDDLSAEQLREMTTRLLTELRHSQALNAKLTHENALLKRMKFAAQSERFNAEQRNLLEDEIKADLAAVSPEQVGRPAAALEAKQQPKRQPLLAHLPRHETDAAHRRRPGREVRLFARCVHGGAPVCVK